MRVGFNFLMFMFNMTMAVATALGEVTPHSPWLLMLFAFAAGIHFLMCISYAAGVMP